MSKEMRTDLGWKLFFTVLAALNIWAVWLMTDIRNQLQDVHNRVSVVAERVSKLEGRYDTHFYRAPDFQSPRGLETYNQ